MSYQALSLPAKQADFILISRPIPQPKAGDVLVKIHATALNPVDWKIQKHGHLLKDYPAVLGLDAAGTIEEVGADVTKFSKGDRVVFQGNPVSNFGVYQQYASLPAYFVAHIPDGLDFSMAATMPLGMITPALGLYDAKTGAGLTPPWETEGKGKYKGQAALVLGGASSVGQYAIQLLKASGFSEIITTASPSNEALVKSIGATHFVDRNADLAAAIKESVTLPITVAVDGVSIPATQMSGFDALSSGGILVTFLNVEVPEEKLKAKNITPHRIRAMFTPDNEPFRKAFFSNFTRFVEENKIIPNRVEIVPGGLNGIIEGLRKLENNEVSGKKVVVLPQDTV